MLLLMVAACSAPTVPTAGFTITSLLPSSGPAGTQVIIQGSGFTATGNTVSLAATGGGQSSQMPNEPSVIPNLSSADGRTVAFNILSVWRPACSYSPPGPCPIANIPTAPGTYGVSVTNSNGTSNSVSLVVTR
jgi:IPT/TIG domain